MRRTWARSAGVWSSWSASRPASPASARATISSSGAIRPRRVALVAGLLLGLIQTFVIVTPYSGLSDAIIFGLLFLMLLIRPNGLFGAAQRDLGGVGR